jgi:hypothetical protein
VKIEVTTDYDSTECEACGTSYADGGTVTIDGVEVLSLPAHAHCYGGDDNSPHQLIIKALIAAGHEVIIDGAFQEIDEVAR